MQSTELLILNGSPSSGKSTVADTIADQLRAALVPCAVIDVDALAQVYPRGEKPFEWKKRFMWENLAVIWPNYVAVGDLKVIIPVVIDDDENLDALKTATPDAKRTICRLVAPLEVLKERVRKREPNEYWQTRLLGLVDRYNQRSQADPKKYADFEVSTHERSVAETAAEILMKLGWHTPA